MIEPKTHKKPFSVMTLQELREEKAYWEKSLSEAEGWGASVGAANGFLRECNRLIERREKETIERKIINAFYDPVSNEENDRVVLAKVMKSVSVVIEEIQRPLFKKIEELEKEIRKIKSHVVTLDSKIESAPEERRKACFGGQQ